MRIVSARLPVPIGTLIAGLAIGYVAHPLMNRLAAPQSDIVDPDPADIANALSGGGVPDPVPTSLPAPDPAKLARQKGEAAKLAVPAMRKLALRFVAGEAGTSDYGPTFYDSPVPFGNALCRVNAYHVASHVFGGPNEAGAYDDDLEITRYYSVWADPIGPTRPDDTARLACTNFRDFDHMFTSDIVDAEEAVAAYAVMLNAARAGGKLPFPVTCERSDPAVDKPQPCDPKAILRRFTLKDLMQVQGDDDDRPDYNFTASRFFLRTPEKQDMVVIYVKAKRMPKNAGDLITVNVGVEKPCG